MQYHVVKCKENHWFLNLLDWKCKKRAGFHCFWPGDDGFALKNTAYMQQQVLKNMKNLHFCDVSIQKSLKTNSFLYISLPDSAYKLCFTRQNHVLVKILIFLLFFIISRTFSSQSGLSLDQAPEELSNLSIDLSIHRAISVSPYIYCWNVPCVSESYKKKSFTFQGCAYATF